MGDFSYEQRCGRCDAFLFSVTNGDASAWKAVAAQGGDPAYCTACGSRWAVEDDGNGGIQRKDVSQPKATGLGAAQSGSIAGGTTVRVDGEALNVVGSMPVVLFDGVPGTNVVVQNDVAIDVDTPAGTVAIDVAEVCQRLDHGTVSNGPYQGGETVTGDTSSATGTVREVGAGYIMVAVTAGVFQETETVTGTTSTASATLNTLTAPVLQQGETVTGQTSGETGNVAALSPRVRVSGLSGALSANELVKGSTTGALYKLSATPTDGIVDVVVESDIHGRRGVDQTLSGAYEYTVP